MILLQAFVIYNFLSLCYEYLGGEGNIMSEIREELRNSGIKRIRIRTFLLVWSHVADAPVPVWLQFV